MMRNSQDTETLRLEVMTHRLLEFYIAVQSSHYDSETMQLSIYVSSLR